VRQRYNMLPYMYTLFAEATETNAPVMRPMFYEFPDDATLFKKEDAFMVGEALLVAPALSKGQKQVSSACAVLVRPALPACKRRLWRWSPSPSGAGGLNPGATCDEWVGAHCFGFPQRESEFGFCRISLTIEAVGMILSQFSGKGLSANIRTFSQYQAIAYETARHHCRRIPSGPSQTLAEKLDV
jgi:hypothetical protein